MKKFIPVLILVLVLGGINGCSSLGTFSQEAQTAVDYICAGEEGKLTAADMLAVLELGAGIYAGDAIDLEKAFQVLSWVKKTGCFVVAELQSAFAVVDDINAAKLKAKGPLRAAATALPQYAALRKYVK